MGTSTIVNFFKEPVHGVTHTMISPTLRSTISACHVAGYILFWGSSIPQVNQCCGQRPEWLAMQPASYSEHAASSNPNVPNAPLYHFSKFYRHFGIRRPRIWPELLILYE